MPCKAISITTVGTGEEVIETYFEGVINRNRFSLRLHNRKLGESIATHTGLHSTCFTARGYRVQVSRHGSPAGEPPGRPGEDKGEDAESACGESSFLLVFRREVLPLSPSTLAPRLRGIEGRRRGNSFDLRRMC